MPKEYDSGFSDSRSLNRKYAFLRVYLLLNACFLLMADTWFHNVGFAQTSVAHGYELAPDFAAKATEYMQARARVTGFSGAILVVHHGKPFLREAYGLANREFDLPNTPETRFRLGSVSKQFTAAAILLLEQRGQLKVSDPVNKFVPDWPEAWRDVTLHHLLSHTGGLPHLTTQAMLDVSALSRSAPSLFKEVGDLMKKGEELQPLDFKPGEDFAYSNVGYIVLSMIIGKVTGKNFCDFLSQEVFGPLGMTSTGCEDPGTILERRASGYTQSDGTLSNADYVDVRFVSGAGSIYSTLDDLLIWERVVDSHRLLGVKETEKLFTPIRADYAYGWWIQTKFGHKVQWHGGNISGFVSQIARYPAEHLFIVVLSNELSSLNRSQVRTIVNELSAMAFAEKVDLPRERKQVSLDSTALDAIVGEYKGKDTFAIAREGGRLMLQFPPGQSVLEIVPESATEFFSKIREHYFTFVMDRNGKVTEVFVRNEGETGRWVKLR